MDKYGDLKGEIEELAQAPEGTPFNTRILLIEARRQRRAIEAMAAWLVGAQTGFGQRDMEGVNSILRGERDDA
jgi:hypothetical protein